MAYFGNMEMMYSSGVGKFSISANCVELLSSLSANVLSSSHRQWKEYKFCCVSRLLDRRCVSKYLNQFGHFHSSITKLGPRPCFYKKLGRDEHDLLGPNATGSRFSFAQRISTRR